MYILKVIKELFLLIDGPAKRKYILLQIFTLISAIIQVAGVASIAPFIGIISNPDVIQTNAILSTIYSYYDFSSNLEFIIAFAITSLTLIIVSNFFSGLTLWLTFRFAMNFGSDLQNRIFLNFLKRDYIYHKTSDYSSAIALINQEAMRFVYMVLQPFLTLTSQITIVFIVLLGLILVDPVIALIAGGIIGGAYLATYVLLKRSLLHHGNVVSERNSGVQAVLLEAFVGIKEIILGRKEAVYKDKFESYNRRGLASQTFVVLAGDLPKLVIETVSFCAILLLAISLLLSDYNSSQIVSILSLYGLAGYKLLPAMQQVYKSLASISSNGGVVMNLSRELEPQGRRVPDKVQSFNDDLYSIELHGVGYSYPNTSQKALNAINATFEKGKINVIAGLSGSGKSTLADVVLGLLSPCEGCLLVNGRVLKQENLASYQSIIGYVPQSIFVVNESVSLNVAFGVIPCDINENKVLKALKLANAEKFVQSLPEGLNSKLGQDGKLLSGGQRQRIGIARALYQEKKILVLDEPTSALDIHSENEFMRCLDDLKDQYLIILISHSPEAIKKSGQVFFMDEGKVIANGEFEELIKTVPDFCAMMNKVSNL